MRTMRAWIKTEDYTNARCRGVRVPDDATWRDCEDAGVVDRNGDPRLAEHEDCDGTIDLYYETQCTACGEAEGRIA